jgi:PAS domain S-box-containing protein
MTTPEQALVSSYDYRLVALSVVIAILAAYAALDVAGRVTSARGRVRFVWLIGGAIAMGIGIWSMHYLGMLAFHLPIPVLYDWPTVLLSLLAAIFASALALFVVSRKHMSLIRASIGSIFMGGGIATMHYTGMAAMRLSARCHWSPSPVVLSVVLAIVSSFVALLLAFYFRGEMSAWSWLKTLSAVVMGAGISIMHYTGMAAAKFMGTTSTLAHSGTAHAITVSSLSIAGIIVVTFMVLDLAVLTSLVGRRFFVQALELGASARLPDIVEERFRLLVSSVKDYAIFMLDLDGRIVSWNEGAERIKGYRAEEIIGEHFSKFYPPEAVAQDRPSQELKIATEQGRFEEEGWRVRKDGSRFWANVVITALRDKTGQLRGFAKVTRDITERKQSEDEVERQRNELERSNAELIAANKELESFSYSVSHDLRAPLRSIDGFSKVLLEDCADRLDEAGKTHLNRIRAATQRMGLLIDDLLNLSRLSRTELHRQSLDISALACSIASDLQKAQPERQIDLRIEDGLKTTADPGLLRIVLENLLSNAWKFTSKRASAHIEFGMARGNGTPAYFVRDDGAGFDPAYADRLFGAFQRLHAMSEFTGTGIGLATVQRIVQRHGGRIWAESAVDRGATFYFTVSETASLRSGYEKQHDYASRR